MGTRSLYRPVGLYELQLIQNADFYRFPPRLPTQPFFYPVLNLGYAIQIARDWNTDDPHSGFMGAVTSFQMDASFLVQFEVQQVGGAHHLEFWIPAHRLAEFNENLRGRIMVLGAFYGHRFEGERTWPAMVY